MKSTKEKIICWVILDNDRKDKRLWYTLTE